MGYSKDKFADLLFDGHGLDRFDTVTDLYNYLADKSNYDYTYEVREIVATFAGGALNEFIVKVLDELGFADDEYRYFLLPTLVLTKQTDSNHKLLSELRKEKVLDYSKGDRAVVITAFVFYLHSYYENLIEFSNPDLGYIPSLEVKTGSSAMFAKMGVRQFVKCLLLGLVKAGKNTDTLYSLAKLFANDTDRLLWMLECNFRHDHTNYNYIDGWFDVESAREHYSEFWDQEVGDYMRKENRKLFSSYFNLNQLRIEINRVKANFKARKASKAKAVA